MKNHFTDHSQTLPKALANANDRAWNALEIALAGDGFLDHIKGLPAVLVSEVGIR